VSLYTRDSVERVKEAVDMVELVGARTDLRRVGSRFTGLCPFHDERTPSFSVNAEHKLYHCFGCGASGDAIGFVQATEALDFKEAIEHLAERYGVELRREQEDPRAEERRRRRQRLLELVDRTASYYARYLWESGEAAKAREYLAARGLEEAVLRDFRVGYAPSAWDKVLIAAQRDGFAQEELAAAGLAQRGRQGGFYDRFRARIMFPLGDARGRVLGFGARAVREDQRPKYLNTSENELYHKGLHLFGIHKARQFAARMGRVIAVEGYTDVLALHQAGITEAVAVMGTALTEEQLAELQRAAGTVFLALDADSAGQDAMLRVARSAEKRGLELRVVAMPEGSDPADLVAQEGADGFRKRLDRSLSVTEFEVRRTLDGADLSTTRGRDRALLDIRPLIAAVPPNTRTRDELMGWVADRLDVPVEYLVTELSTSQAGSPAATVRPEAPAPLPKRPSLDAVARAERTFLAMCLGQPHAGHEFLGRLEPDHFSSEGMRRVRDHLASHFDNPLAELPEDNPALSAQITEVVMLAEEEPASEQVLQLSFLQLELRRVERALRHAEQEGDFERQRSLWPAREQLRGRIDELMGQTT
jgi:DNA primase